MSGIRSRNKSAGEKAYQQDDEEDLQTALECRMSNIKCNKVIFAGLNCKIEIILEIQGNGRVEKDKIEGRKDIGISVDEMSLNVEQQRNYKVQMKNLRHFLSVVGRLEEEQERKRYHGEEKYGQLSNIGRGKQIETKLMDDGQLIKNQQLKQSLKNLHGYFPQLGINEIEVNLQTVRDLADLTKSYLRVLEDIESREQQVKLTRLAIARRTEKAIEEVRKEQINVRLVPKSKSSLQFMLIHRNYPRLELRLSAKHHIEYLVNHLTTKWIKGKPGYRLLLYPDATSYLKGASSQERQVIVHEPLNHYLMFIDLLEASEVEKDSYPKTLDLYYDIVDSPTQSHFLSGRFMRRTKDEFRHITEPEGKPKTTHQNSISFSLNLNQNGQNTENSLFPPRIPAPLFEDSYFATASLGKADPGLGESGEKKAGEGNKLEMIRHAITQVERENERIFMERSTEKREVQSQVKTVSIVKRK